MKLKPTQQHVNGKNIIFIMKVITIQFSQLCLRWARLGESILHQIHLQNFTHSAERKESHASVQVTSTINPLSIDFFKHFLLIVNSMFCKLTSIFVWEAPQQLSVSFLQIFSASLTEPRWNNRLSAALSMPFSITVILIKSGPLNSSCSISWCLEALSCLKHTTPAKLCQFVFKMSVHVHFFAVKRVTKTQKEGRKDWKLLLQCGETITDPSGCFVPGQVEIWKQHVVWLPCSLHSNESQLHNMNPSSKKLGPHL